MAQRPQPLAPNKTMRGGGKGPCIAVRSGHPATEQLHSKMGGDGPVPVVPLGGARPRSCR
eukprot:scaffold82162_cov70-Phaeocystis_antarctica.AAC.3